ncbi:MAG: ParB N-terminal domain-containing protein [Planctomycetes bacterium]|nr:ParB N-terminal domain-containing protein [Planctomycetota bacterium]
MGMEGTSCQIEWVERQRLSPNPANPRLNDEAVPHVAASIKRFGWQVPIVAKRSGEVVAGHTRLRAAEQLGHARVPVIWFPKAAISTRRRSESRRTVPRPLLLGTSPRSRSSSRNSARRTRWRASASATPRSTRCSESSSSTSRARSMIPASRSRPRSQSRGSGIYGSLAIIASIVATRRTPSTWHG